MDEICLRCKVITVIGMIYKSCDYLDFMMRGIQKLDTDYLIVANDPTDAIVDKLKVDGIKHIVYRDSHPSDYYMNRIYRAWNVGGRVAEGDVLVFINSDMAFSPEWLTRLILRLEVDNIPCSRLVESGKLLSGKYAISKDFGRSPKEFNEQAFTQFAEKISVSQVHSGGLFMPYAIFREDFVRSGGYPEGNIYEGGVGAFGTEFVHSGDEHFFYHNPTMRQKRHITVFDSVVYHIQEGELDV